MGILRYPAEVSLAIWFHDVVYDPKAPHGDNENQSSALFQSFAEIIGLVRAV